MSRNRSARLAVALALALLMATGCSSGGSSTASTSTTEGIPGVKVIEVGEATHTEDTVEYDLHPPVGGAHNPVWVNCGFYDEAMPDENAVHDLEHGAVWLAYSPDLPAADIETIHAAARANPKVLATPYPGLPAGEAVVATAWARQLRLSSVDDPRLAAFVGLFQDGAQAPEAGASCSGTPLGTPIP